MTCCRIGRTALVILAAFSSADLAQQQDEQQEPKQVGLVERTSRELYQLDVTVRGRWERIRDLGVDDFELIIAGRVIEQFEVDRVCPEPVATAADVADEPRVGEQRAPPAPRAAAPTTYLFYFDQTFLTMEGRNRSLDVARRLVPELIANGNRGMLVSNGEVLETFSELTTDRDELIAGLERIAGNRQHWTPWSTQEEDRIQDVLDALSGRSALTGVPQPKGQNTARALKLARRYQQEESFRSERALRDFSMVLGRLSVVDPPKAAIYFADRVRSRPGEHLLTFFNTSQLTRGPGAGYADRIRVGSFAGTQAFDRVINEANANGVRLYTVQAEGLTAPPTLALPKTAGAAAQPKRHLYAAEDSLVGLANETGGEAFLHGVRAAKIARHILGDLSCVYLLSFDPGVFPEDRGLRTLLRVKRSGVKAQVRGQILVQSDTARAESRLLAAFAGAGSESVLDLASTSSLIPVDYADGEFTALLQVVVPAESLPSASWDLGASLVSGGKVRKDVSGKVQLAAPGTAVVLESELSFPPGGYEIVMVAHEATTDRILSGQLEGSWPDPGDGPAISLTAVVQPAAAAFVRDGNLRRRGSLGRGGAELESGQPTALLTLVCGGDKHRTTHVQRRLIGEASVDFDDVQLGRKERECLQLRDLIPAGVMTEGGFEYSVSVLRQGQPLASRSTEFRVGSAAEPIRDKGRDMSDRGANPPRTVQIPGRPMVVGG